MPPIYISLYSLHSVCIFPFYYPLHKRPYTVHCLYISTHLTSYGNNQPLHRMCYVTLVLNPTINPGHLQLTASMLHILYTTIDSWYIKVHEGKKVYLLKILSYKNLNKSVHLFLNICIYFTKNPNLHLHTDILKCYHF